MEKLNLTTLPPKEAFFSKLTKENVSDKDYEHAETIWQEFNIKNMKQYHNLYLKTDLRLLADVFETFRDLCLNDYGIDPCHKVSLPGFTFQAALKYSILNFNPFKTTTCLYLLRKEFGVVLV